MDQTVEGLEFTIMAKLRGPGGVTKAPLADRIIASSMEEALVIASESIAWPKPPIKVIGLYIKELHG